VKEFKFINMSTSFDDIENNTKGLIVSKLKQTLSKKQKDFFKHTASIETLKEKIRKTEDHLNSLEAIIAQEIDPEIKNLSKIEIKAAKAIGNSTRMHNFTNAQMDKTKAVIIELCRQAFPIVEPSADDIAFYNKWSPNDYDTFKQQQLKESKEQLSDLMQEEFGMDIDMEDLKDDPESFMRFQQMLNEKMQEIETKKGNRKKSKKQIDAEAKRKAAEEVKNKSLRSIYVSLAKILHPDLEENEALRAEKEELMKTISSAYEAKDLPTLLMLEMQWVYKEAENIDQLSDDKLDVFIDMLKDQVKELKDDLEMLKLHPKYHRVAMLCDLSTSVALGEIMFEKEKILRNSAELNSLAEVCPKPHAKKKIVQFVNEYYEEMMQFNEDDDFDFFDDDEDDFMSKEELEKELEKLFKKMTKKNKK
jgi:hypothetical protein